MPDMALASGWLLAGHALVAEIKNSPAAGGQ